MKSENYIELLLDLVSVILMFFNWKIGISLFALTWFVFHILVHGPNLTLNFLSGASFIAGVIFIFFNWKIAVLFIIGGYLIIKFRGWANRVNYDYYNNTKQESLDTKNVPSLTDQDVVSAFFGLITDGIEYTTIKDMDGNTLLNRDEQKLLILAHISDLLIKHGFIKLKLNLITLFTVKQKDSNERLKEDDDFVVDVALNTTVVNKIITFFEELPKDMSELSGKWFLFNKNFNPIQKSLVISWYVEKAKIIEPLVTSVLLEKKERE
jgi:hypothetical protein